MEEFLAVARDQDELERDIGRQADQILTEQADERDVKRLEKTQSQLDKLAVQIRKINERLAGPGSSFVKNPLRNEKSRLEKEIDGLKKEVDQINGRIAERHQDSTIESHDNGRLPNESRRDFLIRTGKITPFSKLAQTQAPSANLADILLAAEKEGEVEDEVDELESASGPVSHQNLLQPGFANDDSSSTNDLRRHALGLRTQKRRKVGGSDVSDGVRVSHSPSADEFQPLDSSGRASIGEDSGSDFDTEERPTKLNVTKSKAKSRSKKRKAEDDGSEENDEIDDLTGVDDGNEAHYQARLKNWSRKRAAAREKALLRTDDTSAKNADHDNRAEWLKPHPLRPDAVLSENFKIPGDVYPSLFDYQKTGVRWLHELYQQQVGGIVGDEMGLGKTIQIISFLAGLHYSEQMKAPTIVVCPATVMRQWVDEFHKWWPPLRVSILHSSGSGMINVREEKDFEDELEYERADRGAAPKSKNYKSAKGIVDRVFKHGHILVTTYSGLQTYAELLLSREWQYAVLDEGHKIRNPNTAITLYCKELRTPNRIILSGTPMQNNLVELWSLFDFVYPMRLGTLVTFRQQFEYPIKQGGYSHASNLAVETAMKCAETLKDAISPYLLQRFKVDVAADLPKKSERVLFCKLTSKQRREYKHFLDSGDMASITAGKRQPLYGVDILRKICNHPDLVDHKRLSKKPDYDYGDPAMSGKMQVVKALLELWKTNGHKTLLFAQHRIMLDILQRFLNNMEGFNYMRMDGNTTIKDRQTLVDKFNRDPNIHVFLLTTKVGGLGVNLTGADRVIIYDPDWNPSTDVQARERAWRLGQKKEVEIYRLMTAGTIEEKIYHRQIFKQFLTNKILRDPKSRQTFQLKDLHDLFTLADPTDKTETGSIFKGTEIKLKDRNSSETQPSHSISSRKRRATDDEEVDSPRKRRATSDEEVARILPIAPIVREEEFAAEDPTPLTDKEKSSRVLSAIFSRADIHSAHEHDAILNSNGSRKAYGVDPEVIRAKARQVADEAARELEKAQEIARTLPAGVPTWTGTFGMGGHPDDIRGTPARRGGGGGRGGRGGPSGSSVLSGMAARRQNGSASTTGPGNAGRGDNRGASPQTNYMPQGKEFMMMIREFIKVHGGSCYSQNLIDHFNRYCSTPQRTAEFHELLRKLAFHEKGQRGRGKWVLKDKYRE
ncbi:hypothetical protein BT63DRAFT_445606 [Microthyrium microscopicum]|uniref:DNA repair and recombination protein RAD26 n=1 Tax=Microthyrium microscopicum TaxID=703497 RepID=A0A6A6UNQ0_9PEZI|nr:hypothetical protein BT63DRAFT_445606 [Microthyrium microscopicum]